MCLLRDNNERNGGPCFVARWCPIVAILALFGWSYYIFIFQFCFRKMDNIIWIVLLLLSFHLLLIIIQWSWWKCICTSPVEIPSSWHISDEDVNRLQQNNGREADARLLTHAARNLPINMSTPEGTVRICRICWIIKPDRAHHCRTCKMCVRKMDHHCPWVKNCVHFHNFKYFILFLSYAELYALYLFAVLIYDFYLLCQFKFENLRDENMWALAQYAACFVVNMFLLILVAVTVSNLVRNRTTMETAHPPHFFNSGKNNNGFNLGCCFNFREVFGDKWYLWFIPIQTPRGDGLTYSLAIERLNRARGQSPARDEPTRAQVMKSNLAQLLGLRTSSDLDYATN
ncbi:hypothetical protein KR054_009847 [Drosophila jambulina]|nr:hypothetical protein KR054_009847 [Drosophila jambulina]